MADWRITTVRVQDTRQFGQRTVNDHSKANEQLKELAAAAQYSVPNAPGPEDEAIRERLDKMQRDAFDRDYIRSQVTYSPGDGALFEYEIGTGQEFAAEDLRLSDDSCPDGAPRDAQTIDARLAGGAKR